MFIKYYVDICSKKYKHFHATKWIFRKLRNMTMRGNAGKQNSLSFL